MMVIVLLFLNLFPKYYTQRVSVPFKAKTGDSDVIQQQNCEFQRNAAPLKVETKRRHCETIHIGLVCGGYSSSIYIHTMLKSLYFYRVNPIHFHIIVNTDSEKVLKTLFNTWKVPQVNVSFYDINEYVRFVRWVPNGHYSGIYGLLKLLFPTIIPLELTEKIIILDVDLILTHDIFDLWEFFDRFNRKQSIGIVENQSKYYLGKLGNVSPWPAIGKGFNSGVILYNLKRLHNLKWDKLWSLVAKNHILSFGSTSLGDQDILNAVIKENPEILYEVPCFWNVQMSDNTLSSDCYKKHKARIIHWNSPKKYLVRNNDIDYFRALTKTFNELNGNLLNTASPLCDNSTKFPIISSQDECQKYYNNQRNHYRTLLYFKDFKLEMLEFDITFVAHLSYDRLQNIEEIVKGWSGPVSLALYVSDQEFSNAYQFIGESEILKSRSNVAYHAIFKEGENYPINALRNVALKNVATPYVFLADIDFVPMTNLYDILKIYVKSMGSLRKKALVVPAFELIKPDLKIPKNKIELLELLKNNSIAPFLSNVWSSGHAPTNYDKWKKELKPYKVKWAPDYEPYIVVQSDTVPTYDERFSGFGWNKVSHIMELEAQNYEFIVLSDVFIVHKPHPRSFDNNEYRNSVLYRMCLQALKNKFLEELNKKYNSTFNIIKKYESSLIPDRKRRDLVPETTTSVQDSTNYFLAWGGPDKAIGKRESRKSNSDKKDTFSPIEDYYYYESEYPYNLTVFKVDNNETALQHIKERINEKEKIKKSDINRQDAHTSDEEYDYDNFDFDHNQTTIRYFNTEITTTKENSNGEIDKLT